MLAVTAFMYKQLGSFCQACKAEQQRRVAAGMNAVKSSEDVRRNVEDLGIAISIQTAVPYADIPMIFYSLFDDVQRSMNSLAAGDKLLSVVELTSALTGFVQEGINKALGDIIVVPFVEIGNLVGSIIGAFGTGFVMG